MKATEKSAIRQAYLALDILSNSMDHLMGRLWESIYRTALRQEREHRRMGARFTNGQAGYVAPATLAAEFFACKVVLATPPEITSWSDPAGLRDDWRMGHELHALLAADKRLAPKFAQICAQHAEAIAALDYAQMFPRRD